MRRISDMAMNADADVIIERLRESGAYPLSDARGRYRAVSLTAPAPPAFGQFGLDALSRAGLAWRGYEPRAQGLVWAVPSVGDYTDWIDANAIPGYAALADAHAHARLDALASADMLLLPPPGQGLPRVKRYLAAEEELIRLTRPERLARLRLLLPRRERCLRRDVGVAGSEHIAQRGDLGARGGQSP